LDRKVLRQFAKNSPFLKSVIAQEKVLDCGLNIRTYFQAVVSCIQVSWVFGMSFDDHDENFQTLNNRNFSKQMLSRLETKQETLIIPSYSYGSEAENSVRKDKKPLKQSSFDNYKRLVFSIYGAHVESAQN
jgi:hypothetical protein